MNLPARHRLPTLLIAAGCLLLHGCASTQPPHSVEAEAARISAQGEKIIAQAHELEGTRDQRMTTGDSVSIQVWKQDRKTQFAGFPVEAEAPGSGQIFVPHMGLITVTGKTDADVKAELAGYFDTILKNAIIVVEHKQKELPGNTRDIVMSGRHVTITGWVKRPGIYPIDTGITVRDMIAHAGGFEQFAKPGKVYVVRGPTANPEVLTVNMKRILTGRDMRQNIVLEPNDGIYVPPVGMWRTYDAIRIVLLPITAIRDAVWVSTSIR